MISAKSALVAFLLLIGLPAWGQTLPLAAPKPVPAFSFTDAKGATRSLADFQGRLVILDFWATWCEPCRVEFPALDALQEKLGGKGLAVVPVSLDRGGFPAVDKFYQSTKIRSLDRYLGATALSGQLGLRGLPTTLIVDAAGREIGRVEGTLPWDDPAIVAQLEKLLP